MDNKNFDFNPSDYSKFKFGDSSKGKNFGKALAEKFINSYLIYQDCDKQYLAYSSPYQFIPTATMTMFEEFVFQTNKWLIMNERQILETGRIFRNNTYSEDYGELNALDRLKLIGSDLFYIDSARAKGKTLLMLDDIKITGSHELILNRTLDHQKMDEEVIFLYFAEMSNPDLNPNIENVLNYYSIKSLPDLLDLMKIKGFVFNTRAIKFILKASSNDFIEFISNLTDYEIETIFNLAISNNYYAVAPFKKNLDYIKSLISI